MLIKNMGNVMWILKETVVSRDVHLKMVAPLPVCFDVIIEALEWHVFELVSIL